MNYHNDFIKILCYNWCKCKVLTKMMSHFYHFYFYFLLLESILCGYFRESEEKICENEIQKVILRYSEIRCLLLCEDDESCVRIAYQKPSSSIFGNCLLLAKERSNQLMDLNGFELLSDVTVYVKVRFCKTLSCIDLNDL